MSVASCFMAIFIFKKRNRNELIYFGLSFLSALGLYTPYFFYEFKNNFSNTLSLISALPQTEHMWKPLRKSLTSPAQYMMSHKIDFFILVFLVLGTKSLFKKLGNYSKYILFFFSLWIIQFLFYFFSKRSFEHHYNASIVPYYLIFTGLIFYFLYEEAKNNSILKSKIMPSQTPLLALFALYILRNLFLTYDHYQTKNVNETLETKKGLVKEYLT